LGKAYSTALGSPGLGEAAKNPGGIGDWASSHGFFAGLGRFLACISRQTGFNQQIPCCGQTVVSITDTEN
jgi:hypothetical protein